MKKLLSLAVVAVFAVTACGSSTATAAPSTGPGGLIGIAMPTKSSARWVSDGNNLVTTLTIQNLSAYTTYFFRVGGINYNNVVNYVTVGSTQTTVGPSPVGPVISSRLSIQARRKGSVAAMCATARPTWPAPNR